MIIGTHIILTGYGHWLPNDPRGSLSTEFRDLNLASLGEIHFGRRSTQPTREQLRAFHRVAEKQLAHKVLWFEAAGRSVIADAFARVIHDETLTCYACAILPNHAHLLIRRHRLRPGEIEHRVKKASCEALLGLPDFPEVHPIWSKDGCTVFKDNVPAMRTCVRYIAANPPKHRLEPQRWDFVVPYDDWPSHKRGG